MKLLAFIDLNYDEFFT